MLDGWMWAMASRPIFDDGFGGRHQHLADGHRIDVEPDSAAGQSGGKLQFALQKYVSHV